MHLMIILLYGPTGMNYNLIIVPWNIAMLLFALVLFNQKEGMVINRNFFKSKFNLAVCILIGILPMLSFLVNGMIIYPLIYIREILKYWLFV